MSTPDRLTEIDARMKSVDAQIHKLDTGLEMLEILLAAGRNSLKKENSAVVLPGQDNLGQQISTTQKKSKKALGLKKRWEQPETSMWGAWEESVAKKMSKKALVASKKKPDAADAHQAQISMWAGWTSELESEKNLVAANSKVSRLAKAKAEAARVISSNGDRLLNIT